MFWAEERFITNASNITWKHIRMQMLIHTICWLPAKKLRACSWIGFLKNGFIRAVSHLTKFLSGILRRMHPEKIQVITLNFSFSRHRNNPISPDFRNPEKTKPTQSVQILLYRSQRILFLLKQVSRKCRYGLKCTIPMERQTKYWTRSKSKQKQCTFRFQQEKKLTSHFLTLTTKC